PRRNEVFRDVGSEEHAPEDADFIEVQRIPFEPDSALLLCSDGLSDLVPSAGIRKAVERNAADPEAAARALIAAANDAGGKDNVTVVLVEGEDFKAPAPLDAPPRQKSGLLRGAAVFGCGFGCAVLLWLGAVVYTRGRGWQATPVVIAPRVLTAGPGA